MFLNKLYLVYLKRSLNQQSNFIVEWFYWQLYKLLKKHLHLKFQNISYKKNYEINKNNNIVVSLTSIPQRIDCVHLVIKTILCQSLKPSKIVLWLGTELFPEKEKNLPNSLIKLKEFGLIISFCEDIKPHTKYYYAFKKYKNNLIITIDDDIYYPHNMIEKLYEYHKKFPKAIIANRVREIKIIDNKFAPYRSWPINEYIDCYPTNKLLATGVGGVLYNNSTQLNDYLNKNYIEDVALTVDDIWLKSIQVKNNIKVVFTNFYKQPFIEIKYPANIALNNSNVFNSINDVALKKIIKKLKLNISDFKSVL